MKFIFTQDENVAKELISAGYKPLPSGEGVFIFENAPSLTNYCTNNLADGSYVFTDKLFF